MQDATWAAELDPHYAGTANVALANACLGLATQYQNRFALSIAAFQRALDLYSQLPEDDKIRPLAITTQNLAVSFAEAGNRTDAAQCLRDADTLVQQLNDYKLALLLTEKRARTGLTDGDPVSLTYAAHIGLSDVQDRFGVMRALVPLGDCYQEPTFPVTGRYRLCYQCPMFLVSNFTGTST